MLIWLMIVLTTSPTSFDLSFAHYVQHAYYASVGRHPSTDIAASQLSQKGTGLCSECRTVRRLHIRDGTIHLHGPHSNPCSGSNQLPLRADSNRPAKDITSGTSQGEARPASNAKKERMPLSFTSMTSNSSDGDRNDATTMFHPNLTGPMVKHVPKAARPAIGQLLVDIINKILAAPSAVDHWRELI